MATKYYTLAADQKPTAEQLKEVEEAAKHPIVPDKDCPELTKEEMQRGLELANLKRLERVIKVRREQRKKETVSLRLPAKTLAKARLLGKGYTAVLARIIEQALENTDAVELAAKYFSD